MQVGKSAPASVIENWVDGLRWGSVALVFVIPSDGLIGLLREIATGSEGSFSSPRYRVPFTLLLKVALENTHSSPPVKPDLSANSSEKKQQDKNLWHKTLLCIMLCWFCV